jgi:outer membrane protein assembly factor BamB
MSKRLILAAGRRVPRPWAVALTVVVSSVLAVTTGCASSEVSSGVAVSDSWDLEQAYLIGPRLARQLGLRIDLQTRTHPEGHSGIKLLSIQHDAVFVLDGLNFLSRLRRTDLQRLWRLPVTGPVDYIQGITYQPAIERVFLTADASLLVLDNDTGSMVDKQKLDSIANTAPVVFGSFFIYGARNGQVVWHSYEIGHQWRAYQVSPTMRVKPILIGDIVVATGSDGRIMVLDAASAAGIWDKRLLNEVVAEPTAGQGLLYVAGTDQYLWAIELDTGRTRWKYLTETPLVNSPVLIDRQLYQQIPGQGLVCFEAYPVDSPGGVIRWTASQVHGNVIGRMGPRLFVWNAGQRRLKIVEVARGGVIDTADLPQVRHLFMDTPTGEIFAASDDGRVIRLVARSSVAP